MGEKVFMRAYRDFGAVEELEKAADVMRFTASTEGVARDGLVIEADGWRLENYRKNPVVLWAHDYSGRNAPIGKTVDVRVEDGKLIADIVFDRADVFAEGIERKYREGFLNAVSVGWETLAVRPMETNQAPRVAEAELLDISAVPVPGDPDALLEREYRYLRAMVFGDELETQQAEEEAEEAAGQGNEEEAEPGDLEKRFGEDALELGLRALKARLEIDQILLGGLK